MNPKANQPGANEWSSYWGGDTAGAEVFVGQDGQAHPEIAAWWREIFIDLPSNLSIVDLACGSGSVFQHLPKDNELRLHGADISAEALRLVQQRIPEIDTTNCSADSLPFQDGQFDMAVSQFGIEYAGDDAFVEAVRVVASDGQLRLLCHFQDGFIDARNQAHLTQAQVIVNSGFIARSKDLIQAIDTRDEANIANETRDFQPAEQKLGEACRALPEGIHYHLYQGFRKLYEHRQRYLTQDILTWLDDMQLNVEQNITRLEHMCAAARSETEISALRERMLTAGCSNVAYKPFYISGHKAPLAWAIQAEK